MADTAKTQIIGEPASVEILRRDFLDFVSSLELQGIARVKVTFGFAWGNYVYDGPWQQDEFTPDVLLKKVQELELSNTGRIGEDDLYILIPELGYERLYCHHGDVHLIAKTKTPSLNEQCAKWVSQGWTVR